MAEICHLESRHDVIFFCRGWSDLDKICKLVQNDTSTAVIYQKSKPEVEFQYGRRLGEFNGMSSQSHLPHCRVLPRGKFNVMIPELRVALQGAATWRIQWHVIPEPHVTLQGRPTATWWIHCHDPRATCHIAGCKNFIRHIENRFSSCFIYLCFLNAIWALTSGGFSIVSDTLVILALYMINVVLWYR